MRKVYLAGLFLAIASASTAASAAGGNITATLGFRQLDEDQWSPNDTQGLIGGIADFSYWDAPIHLELGLRGSRDSGEIVSNGFARDVRLTVGDFMVGAVLMPDYGPMRPYFGGGLVVATAEDRRENTFGGYDEENDSSAGAYVAGGILWRLTPNFDIGIDGRYIGGTDMTLFGNAVDVDGFSVAMRIGYGWDLFARNDRDSGGRRGPRRRRW